MEVQGDDTLVPLTEFLRQRRIPYSTAMAWLGASPEKLPRSVRIGRRRYFPREEIAAWEARLLAEAATHDSSHTRNSAEHQAALQKRELLSARQAAIIAGKPATKLRHEGAPMQRVARRWYIAPAALRVFLENQRAAEPA